MEIIVNQKSAEVNGNIVAYVDIWFGRSRIIIDKSKRAYINEQLRKDGFIIGITDNIPQNRKIKYKITAISGDIEKGVIDE